MTRLPYHSTTRVMLLLILLILGAGETYAQQYGQYTQYLNNQLVINPAYAGTEGSLSLTFVHRSQWRSLEGAPTTQTFTGHSLVRNDHIGLGLTVIHNRVGVHRNLTALTSYAYHLKTGRESYLSMGVQFGLNHSQSDYASLQGQVQNGSDPRLVNDLSLNFFEFGAGLYFHSPRWTVGISSPKMLTNNKELYDSISFTLSRAHYYMLVSHKIPVSRNLEFEPGILLKYLPGLPLSFDANLNAIINQVMVLGVSYRYQESVDFIFQAKVTPQLRIGYAYDLPIGDISAISGSSHELMVNYRFNFSKSGITNTR